MTGMRTITIAQLNDSHAYFDLHPELFWQGARAVYRPAGGYARIARLVNEIRAETGDRVLFCDGGDLFHGTYPAVRTEGAALIPIANALGLAAMTAHWEFAYGPATLEQRVAELAFPLLACNVYREESDALLFPPYTVTEVGGVRLGIVGIASNIVDKTMPPAFSEGVYFTSGREELPALIERLRGEERVDLVLLLSHLGFPQDLALLAETPGVDVCLSAHTHNRLVAPARQGGALVIQSGCHGSFVGRLDLTVEGGKIVDSHHRLLTVDAAIAPDPEVDALVRRQLAPFADELAEVVGETATALNRATTLEATMDNLLLAALLEATGAEIAFSNGWRYGAPVPPGPVTLNDLYNMAPMDPPVSTVELTGEEIGQLLEENLTRTFSGQPFQQMGGYLKRALGLNAYIKLENPDGYRLQQLFIGDEEVRPRRVYTAAFITAQGVGPRYGRNRRTHDLRLSAALRAYLTRHRPARADLRGTFTAV